ncbi:hypothetical protein OL239_11650 [Arthrobacter sp. ATA002]|uniref:hypothetical protein n=1 Tax=Arthrobacter sp. ATA002 TaxID=2991715 RepID=UPI0022A774B7|nr:hypothetical protein [Arthrobacter sp. ATA002]WAP50680.1 hypothetical protein OL239_11650 [Arthrobacter sp. ATA002]
MNVVPLSKSVAGQLQELIAGSESVELFLEAFAVHAAGLVSGGIEVLAEVTLLRNKEGTTVAGSSGSARALDEVQYGFGTGRGA